MQFLFFKRRNKVTPNEGLQKRNSDFSIKRRVAEEKNHSFIEPNLKNMNLPYNKEMDAKFSETETDSELIKTESMRSKISEAIKNRTLKINGSSDHSKDDLDLNRELSSSNV